MFYFFIQVITSLIIIMFTYHIFKAKEITILETIILLFIFNICLIGLYNSINIIYIVILSLIVISCYYLYKFLYKLNIDKKYNPDKVLINRGIINFHELIKENYSLDTLIYNLKRKGIDNPSLVDYCIKKDNDLIIFRKNSIKNYPISLIIDGHILKDNLFSINKSIEWLDKKLNDNDLELKNINYAYFKNKEVYFITN
ncbi:MAG: DUF421 domain-containing protein [Bacilli bacterium]|nr:DUF421 domain-containing protein [Bacilli bacterium]